MLLVYIEMEYCSMNSNLHYVFFLTYRMISKPVRRVALHRMSLKTHLGLPPLPSSHALHCTASMYPLLLPPLYDKKDNIFLYRRQCTRFAIRRSFLPSFTSHSPTKTGEVVAFTFSAMEALLLIVHYN